MIGLIVKNFIIIGEIGGVFFASQSAYFSPAVESLYASGIKSDNSFTAKSNEWLKTNVCPKLGMVNGASSQVSGPLANGETSLAQWGGEVAKNQAALQEGIIEQKNNLIEKSTQATKKLIAQKFLQFLGVAPEELGSCPATTAPN